jgi:hypothetical protein
VRKLPAVAWQDRQVAITLCKVEPITDHESIFHDKAAKAGFTVYNSLCRFVEQHTGFDFTGALSKEFLSMKS